MIYISSSCIKDTNIINILQILKKNGINNIELSGGTKKFPEFFIKIKKFIDENNISVRLHNYFPPPDKDFVVNIASEDDDIFKQSIDHCKNAINLSKQYKADKYALHAGFLIDPKPSEIGIGKIVKEEKTFFNRDRSISRMRDALNILNKEADGKVKLYLENNVLSKKNYEKYRDNPFFLTDLESYNELQEQFNFNLLLDLAHLKVTCNSLGLNFEKEANYLINCTDYIHISGNNGVEDYMESIIDNDDILKILKKNDLKNKTFTIEIKQDIKTIMENYYFLKDLVEKN